MRIRPITHRLVACLLATILTAAAAVAATLVAPAPAVAVPGLTAVEAHSIDGSGSPKSVIAQCPAGTTVIGGGGYITGGSAIAKRSYLVAMRPVVTVFGTGYQVIGTEDEIGDDGGWVAFATAICAPEPPGLEYVWGQSAYNSASLKTAPAYCPDHKFVLGAGAAINGAAGEVGLRYVVPTPDPPDAVIAQAHEVKAGTSASWSLTSWAVCAYPPPGLERVVEVGVNNDDIKWVDIVTWVEAGCPRNKELLGVGGQADGDPRHVALRGASPMWFPSEARAWAQQDGTQANEDVDIAAIAICADRSRVHS